MGLLNIAFFWHMHQPYYRDPLRGEYTLPWVRLHACKGYYDMISLLEEYPAIRQTFNIVPSLLRQLNEYARGEARDIFLEHTRKPAEELSPEEKKFILINFFLCNRETMIKPYPAYWALLQKRGLKIPEYRADDLLHQFSSQDFRDLQVWFNLCWFGHRARRKKECIPELIQQGRFFSEADKDILLKAQAEIIQELIPLYQSLAAKGQAEITTSPFYHPILPLLIDWKTASRAMPKVSLPGSFSHPEDAERQIQKAVEYYQNLFGCLPKGMWPSEGSVCPELIPLVQRAGIRWMATDEGILFKSLSGDPVRQRLYRPYRVKGQGAEVSMVFRDRNLSDLIGFTYSKNPPLAAASDLFTHLMNIQKSQPDDPGRLVLIALDGENPWEYYPDGGHDFLRELYEKLSHNPLLSTVTISGFLERHPPREVVDSLYSGSWIDQNFRIWIGSREDNQAWDCLRRTRAFLEKALENLPNVSAATRQRAWDEIYIAEGSDWFWWYGDDFTSDNDDEFDRLFRSHLSQVHLLLESPVPDYLKIPITLAHEIKPAVQPVGLLSPTLDGRVTHFYEWQEAGFFPARSYRGAMYRDEGFISGFYFGFDLQHLYFRLDPIPRETDPLPNLQFHIRFFKPRKCQITFPVQFPEGREHSFSFLGPPKGTGRFTDRFATIRSDQIVELSIPFAALQFQPKQRVDFFLQVQQEDLELERFPRNGYLSLIIPDLDYESTLWQV